MDSFFALPQQNPPAPAPGGAPAPAAPPSGAQAPAPPGPAPVVTVNPGTEQPPPQAQSPMGGGGFGQMVPMLVMMFVVFYFLLIRPQNKQKKERDVMIANLKKNDRVFTSFGLYGIIKQVRPEDNEVVLCIDESKDVRIRVSKASIAGLDKAAGGKSEPTPETPEKAKS